MDYVPAVPKLVGIQCKRCLAIEIQRDAIMRCTVIDPLSTSRKSDAFRGAFRTPPRSLAVLLCSNRGQPLDHFLQGVDAAGINLLSVIGFEFDHYGCAAVRCWFINSHNLFEALYATEVNQTELQQILLS